MFKSNMKTSEFFGKWLDLIIKGNVRYSTYNSYKGYIENHILRMLPNKAIEELKPCDIQQFVVDLKAEGRICSRTIGIIVRMMKSALTYALDYEIIAFNPVRRIKLPTVIEGEIEIFSNQEQTKIEQAILKSGDNRLYAILLTLYSGLRIGELCALKWKNVDILGKRIYIKKSLSRTEICVGETKKIKYCESEPKTKKSRRMVFFPDFFVPIFIKMKKESKSEFVFSMKNGNLIHPRTMQHLHKKTLRLAGVRYNNFHALRHTFATRVSELNCDPKTVSETLGHSNTMITLNRYTHSLNEQKMKMTFNLNSYFESKQLLAEI